MLSIIALWFAALFAPDSQITWMSVSPVSDRTEIVIRVQGPVTYKEPFMMDDGRLVLDIAGVRTTAEQTQTVNRGGITRVRVGQYQPDVARIVVELAKPVEYTVKKEEGLIRISVPNPSGLFEPWSQQMLAPPARALPPQPVATEPKPANTSVRTSAAPVPQTRQDPLITFTARDEPLTRVLGTLSSISGKTIVAAQKIGANPITVEILPPGQTWRVILESILEANNLVQRELPSGTIVIEDASTLVDRAKQQSVVSTSIPLRYVNADSVAISVTSSLTKDLGSVSVVRASNSLLITDTQQAIDRIRAVVDLLDVRPVQVEINATVAFIDRTTLEALGVTYDLKDSRGTQLRGLADNFVDTNGNGTLEPDEATSDNVVLLGGNSIAALGNANARVASPALTLATSLVLGRHTLISFLEALQTVSLSDIQAKPMVTIQNHYKAKLQVGERTPVRVIDASSAAGNQGARATVSFQETGIILEVTPHVTGDQVQLEMRLERSNPTAASADIGLIFVKQTAEVVVLAQDGQTVVISGLTIIEKTKSRTGIPFLMDLPLIGALFRNDSDREAKRDLLMLVTPHLVREGQ